MQRTHFIWLFALIPAVLGLLSLRLVLLDVTDARAASRANPIDIMQMMQEAKDLPVQAYDAI
jgi:hypothetical protein